MTVLAFSDTHFPFQHSSFLPFLKKLKKKYHPDKIIHCGDLTDQYIFSRYPKHYHSKNGKEELQKTQNAIDKLGNIFPEMVLIMGNHDERYKKRIEDARLPVNFENGLEELFGLPLEWDYYPDYYQFEDVFYYHGQLKGGLQPALSMTKSIGQSVVCGHWHGVAGVGWISPLGKKLFGMDLGCGIDINSYGFYYAKEILNKPLLGAGIIQDGKYPQYFIMED